MTLHWLSEPCLETPSVFFQPRNLRDPVAWEITLSGPTEEKAIYILEQCGLVVCLIYQVLRRVAQTDVVCFSRPPPPITVQVTCPVSSSSNANESYYAVMEWERYS